MINYSVVSEHRIWNRSHLIEIVVAGRIDHRQFRPAHVLGVIFRVAARQTHVTFDCEKISEKSTRQHNDQPGVREMNAQLAPGPPETFRVGSDEIDQQHGPDEMATGKNRNLETLSFRRPPHKHALEITLLRFMDPEMHLRQRAGQNQRHPRRQTNDRQLQRCKDVDDFVQHLF